MERSLRHNELPLGVEAGHEAGVDEVAALLVVRRLQLDPTVIVRQDVGESVLRPIDGKIRGCTKLIPANVLELLVLLAKPEVGVGGHDTVVLPKVLQLHWPGSLND